MKFDISDEALDLVDELLPGASPTGALGMGMGTAACLGRGVQPPRELLSALRGAASIHTCQLLIESWLKQIGRREAAVSKDRILLTIREALIIAESFISDELEQRKESFLPTPTDGEVGYIGSAKLALKAVRAAIRKLDAEARATAEDRSNKEGGCRNCHRPVKHELDPLCEACVRKLLKKMEEENFPGRRPEETKNKS